MDDIDFTLQQELSLCHKLYKFETQCRKPLIFQSMNYVGGNNLILKYQRFTSSGCKDTRITKIEFVTKTQFLFLYSKYKYISIN